MGSAYLRYHQIGQHKVVHNEFKLNKAKGSIFSVFR